MHQERANQGTGGRITALRLYAYVHEACNAFRKAHSRAIIANKPRNSRVRGSCIQPLSSSRSRSAAICGPSASETRGGALHAACRHPSIHLGCESSRLARAVRPPHRVAARCASGVYPAASSSESVLAALSASCAPPPSARGRARRRARRRTKARRRRRRAARVATRAAEVQGAADALELCGLPDGEEAGEDNAAEAHLGDVGDEVGEGARLEDGEADDGLCAGLHLLLQLLQVGEVVARLAARAPREPAHRHPQQLAVLRLDEFDGGGGTREVAAARAVQRPRRAAEEQHVAHADAHRR
eukprot:CAMPEP_0182823004 /NCGR_PEP_ID=MMETSP0006_2-20121128/14513_1 /TAXON_ID=97485 /ORGANISM="Prymnesium parvum, Strain Texoma1" /LENGTH=299 /DNA_ID=CAMNT_0024949881 /DNA_START=81 /DNA_END=977 /DNA_ORIENTATION=+